MAHLYASVAIGTAATLLTIILLLLRAEFQGRRPVVALTRWWVATDTGTCGLVVALLAVVAVHGFTWIPANDRKDVGSDAAVTALAGASSTQGTTIDEEENAGTAQATEALRTYADTTANKQPSQGAASAPDSVQVPDVETMIAKLVERLQKQPNDAKGWKMLGWSYLNTDRPDEAAKAYEAALKVDPDDIEIKKGLEAARTAQAGPTPSSPPGTSDPATSSAENMKVAEGLSGAQTDSMIRGMVDQLATRLEASPNDEGGWLRLMRSRMTLGEKEAAKAALTKARETFARDTAAMARLTATARELGVESN